MTDASPESPHGDQTTPPPLSKEERTWGMACHLSGLSAYAGLPFGWVLGPLIVWLIKKDEMPFVDEQGKEAVNFGLSVTIYGAVGTALICLFFVGIVLLGALSVFQIVFCVIGAVKANDGEAFRYPLTIRFLS